MSLDRYNCIKNAYVHQDKLVNCKAKFVYLKCFRHSSVSGAGTAYPSGASSSILLCGLCCLFFSFLCNVCSSLFGLVCFFASFPFQCCLSFDLRLTFELLNAYNFETCFATLYDCTLRRVSRVFCVILKRLVLLGCIVGFELPCLILVVWELSIFLFVFIGFGEFLNFCVPLVFYGNLKTSCVPLVFNGI